MEEYHKKGYLIINLLDIKDEFENCFSMFEPKSDWHINTLKYFGKKTSKKKVKIYHPFTFNIPKKLLPDINFFTFPIKSLDREDIVMLLEAYGDTESVKLMMNVIRTMPNTTTFYEFIHILKKAVEKADSKEQQEENELMFGLDISSKSTQSNLAEILGSLTAFEDNYMLTELNNDLNLNLKEIFNDQEHYHCLVTNWIGRKILLGESHTISKDMKLKYFVIQKFFRSIINNIKDCKYPICFVIEEVKRLTPIGYMAQNYQKRMSIVLSEQLITIRNKGLGCVAVLNTQNMFDVNGSVIDASNFQLLMRTQARFDLNNYLKVFGMTPRITREIQSLGLSEYKINNPSYLDYTFIGIPPSHGHKETSYNFFKLYKEAYPEKLKKYNEIINYMEIKKKESKELLKEAIAQSRKNKIKEPKEKTEKIEKELEEVKEEKKQLEVDVKEELMQRAYELYIGGKSLRGVGKELNINYESIRKYINKVKEKQLMNQEIQ